MEVAFHFSKCVAKMNGFLGFAVAVCAVLCNGCMGSISYADREFFANLTKDYDRNLRPVFNRSQKTLVGIEIGMNSIFNLDEKNEVISCNVYFIMRWKDDLLTWDGVNDEPYSIQVSSRQIWTPSIVLSNSVNEDIWLNDGANPVLIFKNGAVTHLSFRRTTTRCKVNIKMFPFDQQICYLQLSTIYAPVTGEYITISKPTVNLETFDENGEFELESASMEIVVMKSMNVDTEVLIVTLRLNRRKAFYVLNIIVPVVCLSFLNIFVFLMPEESGEKVGLSVSLLLSYAVFLTLINSYLPENSDHVCFFSVYLAMLVIISTLICLSTILLLALKNHLKEGNCVPKMLQVCALKSNKVLEIANEQTVKHNGKVISKCNVIAFVVFCVLTVSTNVVFFANVL